MLKVNINRYKVNCTTKNRIYSEYYAEKKTNVNVCPKKCVTLSLAFLSNHRRGNLPD